MTAEWQVRVHLTSGDHVETEVTVPADFDEDDVLLRVREQLVGDLDWVTVGSLLLFPSRVAAVELL